MTVRLTSRSVDEKWQPQDVLGVWPASSIATLIWQHLEPSYLHLYRHGHTSADAFDMDVLCGVGLRHTDSMVRDLALAILEPRREFAALGGGSGRVVSKQAPLPRALHHALHELVALVQHAGSQNGVRITRHAVIATVDLLCDSLTRSSVFPSLSADGDGGLFVEWWADDVNLVAEIDDAGEIVIARRDVNTGRRQTWHDPSSLRERVRELTEEVRRKAPDWRDRFDAQASQHR